MVVSVTSIHADNCTTSKRESVQSLPEFQAYQTACSNVIVAKATEADAQPNILCGDSTCLKAMASLSAALPRCEYAGSPLNAVFEGQIKACNAINNKTVESSPQPVALTVASRASTATLATGSGLAVLIAAAYN